MAKRSFADPVIHCPNCSRQMVEGHIQGQEQDRWVAGKPGKPTGPAFEIEVYRCPECAEILRIARRKAD